MGDARVLRLKESICRHRICDYVRLTDALVSSIFLVLLISLLQELSCHVAIMDATHATAQESRLRVFYKLPIPLPPSPNNTASSPGWTN